MKSLLIFIVALLALHAFAQTGTPTPLPSTPPSVAAIVPPAGLDAAATAAFQAGVVAAKASLLQSVSTGSLQVTGSMMTQLGLLWAALNTITGLLQGLVAMAQGKPVTMGGIGTLGAPSPVTPVSAGQAAITTKTPWWQYALSGAFFVLKLVGGNL